MGLTDQYLAYHSIGSFNLIASPNVNVSFVTYDKTDGRFIAVGAAENVFIWDLRLGEKVLEFNRGKEEVTALQKSPDCLHLGRSIHCTYYLYKNCLRISDNIFSLFQHLAVGYADGVVRIFSLQSSFGEEISAQFTIHRSGVNVLRYDSSGKINKIPYFL